MNTVDSENDSQTSGCHIKESDIRKEKFEENEQFVGNHVFAIATMVDNTLVLSHAEPVETEDDLVIVDAKHPLGYHSVVSAKEISCRCHNWFNGNNSYCFDGKIFDIH